MTAIDPSPPAPRFERLVAPGRARPGLWRILLGAVVALGLTVGFYAIASGALLVAAGPETAERVGRWLTAADSPAAVLTLLASFAFVVASSLAASWLFHRRGLSSLTGPVRPLFGDALRAAAVLLGLSAIGLLIPGALAETRPNLPPTLWLAVLPLAVLATALQTFAEELLFRGYLQSQLAARFAPARMGLWGARVVWGGLPAVLFAGLHFDPARMGAAAPLTVTSALLFGLVAADLTARTGSLGAAWGLHFANNIVALTVVGLQGSLTGLALRVTEFPVETLADRPWLLALNALPLLLAWALLRRLTAA